MIMGVVINVKANNISFNQDNVSYARFLSTAVNYAKLMV